MNYLKNHFKIIIAFIVGVLIASGITAYATITYYASGIKYTENKTVEQALNELYEMKTTKSISGYKMANLIPAMTSNTTPSGTIVASSYYSGRPAYQAFSGVECNLNDAKSFWFTNQKNGETISYTWDDDVYIGLISFYKHVKNDLTIEYLNKNNEWVSIVSYPSTGDEDYAQYIEYIFNNLVKTNTIRFRFAEGSEGFLATVKAIGYKKIN